MNKKKILIGLQVVFALFVVGIFYFDLHILRDMDHLKNETMGMENQIHNNEASIQHIFDLVNLGEEVDSATKIDLDRFHQTFEMYTLEQKKLNEEKASLESKIEELENEKNEWEKKIAELEK